MANRQNDIVLFTRRKSFGKCDDNKIIREVGQTRHQKQSMLKLGKHSTRSKMMGNKTMIIERARNGIAKLVVLDNAGNGKKKRKEKKSNFKREEKTTMGGESINKRHKQIDIKFILKKENLAEEANKK